MNYIIKILIKLFFIKTNFKVIILVIQLINTFYKLIKSTYYIVYIFYIFYESFLQNKYKFYFPKFKLIILKIKT